MIRGAFHFNDCFRGLQYPGCMIRSIDELNPESVVNEIQRNDTIEISIDAPTILIASVGEAPRYFKGTTTDKRGVKFDVYCYPRDSHQVFLKSQFSKITKLNISKLTVRGSNFVFSKFSGLTINECDFDPKVLK